MQGEKRKLKLNRETLRTLSERQARRVVGGTETADLACTGDSYCQSCASCGGPGGSCDPSYCGQCGSGGGGGSFLSYCSYC